MMQTIELNWQGPLPLFNPKTKESVAANFDFESKSGLYLWCFEGDAQFRVWYVGKSNNLSDRFSQHIVSQINGGGVILDSDELQKGGKFVAIYEPNAGDIHRELEFLCDFDRLSNHAYRSLILSRIFVSTIETQLDKLFLIESGLIEALRLNPVSKPFLVNRRVSCAPQPNSPIQIISIFPSDIIVSGLEQAITY